MTKEEMRKLNLSIIRKSFEKATRGVNRKYHFMATNNSGYEHVFTTKNRCCYIRVEVDCDIRVNLIITTLNYEKRIACSYFQYAEGAEIDFAEYEKCSSVLFDYLFTEGLNMPFAPEWRNRMIPSNATEMEMAMLGCQWFDVWEHRLAEKHSFSNLSLLHYWIDRCTGEKNDHERYCFESHWNKE